MTKPLVERLLDAGLVESVTTPIDARNPLIGLLLEAATEIERLRAERDKYARCLNGGVDCAQEKLRLRACLLEMYESDGESAHAFDEAHRLLFGTADEPIPPTEAR
jgi:DNA-binding MarR family transcriptional regulator